MDEADYGDGGAGFRASSLRGGNFKVGGVVVKEVEGRKLGLRKIRCGQ